MISAENLLKPIADDNPCGDDLSYDPGFQELDVLIKGKPETQFSPAEPPDWDKLYQRCQDLLTRSKDLRIVTALCLAAVKVDGLAGLKEGFILLKDLLVNSWEPVHPRLDPEDDNDPTQRVNAIAALAMPRGTYGDPMRFLERLHEVPLTNSVQLGKFSLADLDRAESGQPGEEGGSVVGVDQIEGAFRDTNAEDLGASHETVVALAGLVREIDTALTEAVGAGSAASLDALTAELKAIEKCLARYVASASTDGGEETPKGEVAGTSGGAGPRISGEIQSRQDVVRMLDKICDYYARTEPSSPVPSVLRRAQRLSEKDFLEIIKDLCPDAESTVRTITGEPAE